MSQTTHRNEGSYAETWDADKSEAGVLAAMIKELGANNVEKYLSTCNTDNPRSIIDHLLQVSKRGQSMKWD